MNDFDEAISKLEKELSAESAHASRHRRFDAESIELGHLSVAISYDTEKGSVMLTSEGMAQVADNQEDHERATIGVCNIFATIAGVASVLLKDAGNNSAAVLMFDSLVEAINSTDEEDDSDDGE